MEQYLLRELQKQGFNNHHREWIEIETVDGKPYPQIYSRDLDNTSFIKFLIVILNDFKRSKTKRSDRVSTP